MRDTRRLNSFNISKKLEELDFFDPEMEIVDVNEVTLAVKDKLNLVINSLAPTKRIQLKKDSDSKRDEESAKIFKEARKTKFEAIRDKDCEKFRKARNLTAVGTRMCYRKQAEKLKHQMSHQKLKWKRMRESKNQEMFPTVLKKGERLIMGQSEIANTLASHYDEKILNIRKEFDDEEDKALEILEKLCPRRSDQFEFEEISESTMYNIINDASASKTVADDQISMDVIKQIPSLMTVIMTKIFNKMITQRKFPDCLKLARVIPLKKSGKCKLEKDSYRPINILNPLEKLLEEGLKRQLNSYFEDNDIIPDNHHGGRPGHSMLTAKAVIDKLTADSIENNKETAILTTDLTAAYNLVDHRILIKKLSFHRVGKGACELMESFLSDRKIFVEV